MRYVCKTKNGGKHTNRTDNSVSVCILSTDGQAALRIKRYEIVSSHTKVRVVGYGWSLHICDDKYIIYFSLALWYNVKVGPRMCCGHLLPTLIL